MKIIYIANIRVPTEKAHGYQVVKVCENLATLGHGVELWVPYRLNFIKENIFEFYKVKNNFKVRYIGRFDFFILENIIGSKISFLMQSLSFLFLVWARNVRNKVIYTRNPEIIWLLQKYNCTFFSAHNWPVKKEKFFKHLVKNSQGIVANSFGTREVFQEKGFSKITVVPNGVDLEDFEFDNKDEIFVTNSKNKIVVMYVGHLYHWKGVDTIVECAKNISDEDFVFVIVGGVKEDVERHNKIIKHYQLENVILTGTQSHSLIPKYLKKADILLLPNLAVSEESIKYTSPIKMFEYMASGKPIIASKLPSIEEVLSENNATLISPGNYKSLIKELMKFKADPNLYKNKADVAKNDVLAYTWSNHAKKLMKFFNTICAE